MFDKLIDLLIYFIQGFQIIAIIHPYERGVVLRLGKFQRTLKPGFHWVIPLYIDAVLTHDTVLSVRNLGAQTLTTLDNKKIVVGSMVTYKVSDIRILLLEVEEAETVLENIIYGMITAYVTANDYDTVASTGFVETLQKIAKKAAKPLGLKVVALAFTDISEIRTIRLIQDAVTTLEL